MQACRKGHVRFLYIKVLGVQIQLRRLHRKPAFLDRLQKFKVILDTWKYSLLAFRSSSFCDHGSRYQNHIHIMGQADNQIHTLRYVQQAQDTVKNKQNIKGY